MCGAAPCVEVRNTLGFHHNHMFYSICTNTFVVRIIVPSIAIFLFLFCWFLCAGALNCTDCAAGFYAPANGESLVARWSEGTASEYAPFFCFIAASDDDDASDVLQQLLICSFPPTLLLFFLGLILVLYLLYLFIHSSDVVAPAAAILSPICLL